MVRLSERSCVYLAGLSVVGVGFVLFVIGFATPNWIEQHHVTGSSFFQTISVKSTVGLWQICGSSLGITMCVAFSSTNGVYDAIRSLECVALIFFIVFGIIAFLHNFTNVTNTHVVAVNRFLTVLAIFGGLLGIIGAILFAVTNHRVNLSWSFGIVIAGCVLAIIGSILMACSPASESTTSAGNAGVVFQTTQYPMGANQQEVHVISTTNHINQYGPPPARAQSYAIG